GWSGHIYRSTGLFANGQKPLQAPFGQQVFCGIPERRLDPQEAADVLDEHTVDGTQICLRAGKIYLLQHRRDLIVTRGASIVYLQSLPVLLAPTAAANFDIANSAI